MVCNILAGWSPSENNVPTFKENVLISVLTKATLTAISILSLVWLTHNRIAGARLTLCLWNLFHSRVALNKTWLWCFRPFNWVRCTTSCIQFFEFFFNQIFLENNSGKVGPVVWMITVFHWVKDDFILPSLWIKRITWAESAANPPTATFLQIDGIKDCPSFTQQHTSYPPI